MIDPLVPKSKSSPPRRPSFFKKNSPIDNESKGEGSVVVCDDNSSVSTDCSLLRASAPPKLLSPLDESFLLGDDQTEASDWLETNTSFVFQYDHDTITPAATVNTKKQEKPVAVVKKVCFSFSSKRKKFKRHASLID